MLLQILLICSHIPGGLGRQACILVKTGKTADQQWWVNGPVHRVRILGPIGPRVQVGAAYIAATYPPHPHPHSRCSVVVPYNLLKTDKRGYQQWCINGLVYGLGMADPISATMRAGAANIPDMDPTHLQLHSGWFRVVTFNLVKTEKTRYQQWWVNGLVYRLGMADTLGARVRVGAEDIADTDTPHVRNDSG